MVVVDSSPDTLNKIKSGKKNKKKTEQIPKWQKKKKGSGDLNKVHTHPRKKPKHVEVCVLVLAPGASK